MLGEIDTKYQKTSQKSTPIKADHKHEYISPFAMMHIRRFDGTITKDKYKFSIRPKCVICGHTPRRVGKNRVVIEVEVSPKEYRQLKK
jgi:hypothetical protein